MGAYEKAVRELTEASNSVVYFVDDRCPTCNHPDKDELNHFRELCKYASHQGVRIKGIVMLPGNSAYKYLTQMLQSVSVNHELVLPAMFYRGSWYQHAEDMLDTIQHVTHQAEENIKRQAEQEINSEQQK